MSTFAEHYSDRTYWDKLSRFARRAGREVAQKSLCMYYAAQSAETPVWAKGVILGALGYFIFPADAVPDFLPAIGFADDLGMLATALLAVATHITAEHRQRAEETLSQWFR